MGNLRSRGEKMVEFRQELAGMRVAICSRTRKLKLVTSMPGSPTMLTAGRDTASLLIASPGVTRSMVGSSAGHFGEPDPRLASS